MYKRYRFPAEIIQYAVWLYYRFNICYRDADDLLAERGIVVTHEAMRAWCNKFGLKYARRSRRRHQRFGDTLYIDEVFVKIDGKQRYLWRSVANALIAFAGQALDQDGEVVLQARRNGNAAKHFFKRLLNKSQGEPIKIVTDKLRRYNVAHRELMPDVIHISILSVVTRG